MKLHMKNYCMVRFMQNGLHNIIHAKSDDGISEKYIHQNTYAKSNGEISRRILLFIGMLSKEKESIGGSLHVCCLSLSSRTKIFHTCRNSKWRKNKTLRARVSKREVLGLVLLQRHPDELCVQTESSHSL